MKNLITILCLVCITVCSCQKAGPCPTLDLEQSTIDDQELYQIIDVILETYFNEEYYHINQATLGATSLEFLTYYASSLSESPDATTLNEYIDLNTLIDRWGPAFRNPRYMISSEEISCLFEDPNFSPGWTAYYNRYKKSSGILSFAKPLIKGDQALLEYVDSCHWLCGYGYIITLKKEDGKWKIIENKLTWIS